MAAKTAENVARVVKVIPGALTQRPTHDFGPDAASASGRVPADTLGVGLEALVAEERKELVVGQYRPGAEHARDGALPLHGPLAAGEGSSLRARGLGTEATFRHEVDGLVTAVAAGEGVLREAYAAGAGDAGGGVGAAGPEARPGLGEADKADRGLAGAAPG